MAAPGRSDGPAPSAVADLLAHARQGLDRVAPEALEDERAAGALVVDIRPEANRTSEGSLPGSVVIDRNVLEWRLDPTSPDRIAQADRRTCVSSSCATRAMRRAWLPSPCAASVCFGRPTSMVVTGRGAAKGAPRSAAAPSRDDRGGRSMGWGRPACPRHGGLIRNRCVRRRRLRPGRGDRRHLRPAPRPAGSRPGSVPPLVS